MAAARLTLAEEGFLGFGINAVARRAGCDKQLIYRYFGGIEGLIDALGADLASWIETSILEIVEPPLSYGELVERLILGFLHTFRNNVLVQRIAAWELAAPSPLVDRLTAARGAAMSRWVTRMRGELTPPEGLDAPALNAVLIAAIQQLVLAGAAAGGFSGVPLKSEADWDRIAAAARLIVRRVYGE